MKFNEMVEGSACIGLRNQGSQRPNLLAAQSFDACRTTPASRAHAHVSTRRRIPRLSPARLDRGDAGVHAYNTAVFQAGDRRVMVENNADVARLAYAAMRVLKQRVETVCFVTDHGETFRPTPAHFHYSHVETLQGHDKPGAGDALVGEPQDLDRLQLALTEIGYKSRGIVPASMSAIAADCAVVADIGPRTAFAAGETDVIGHRSSLAPIGFSSQSPSKLIEPGRLRCA